MGSGEGWGQVRVGVSLGLGSVWSWGQVRVGVRLGLGSGEGWGQVRVGVRLGSGEGWGQGNVISRGKSPQRYKYKGVCMCECADKRWKQMSSITQFSCFCRSIGHAVVSVRLCVSRQSDT